MLAFLVTALLPAASAPLPRAVAVHGDSPEYRALASAEVTYTGRLQNTEVGCRLMVLDGWGRGGNSILLHAPGKVHRLASFDGQHVRVTGKVGEGSRLWPASIERFSRDRVGTDGVLARSAIPLQGAALGARRVATILARDADTLATTMKIHGPTAGVTATKVAAARLGREAIDWSKHMVVGVSLGLAPATRELAIVRAFKQDGALVVAYRLRTRAFATGGFHVAGETALVPRHDGPVRFLDLAQSS